MRAEKSLPSAQRIALKTVPFHSIPIRLTLLMVYSVFVKGNLCRSIYSYDYILHGIHTGANDNNDTDMKARARIYGRKLQTTKGRSVNI